MDNGAELYRRYLDGCESAFDDIVDLLFDRLVFFINGYVHDIYAAEDIAMDALSDLFANKKRFNFKVSLKTYVFMIGKSKALNYLKHRKRVPIVDASKLSEEKKSEQDLENSLLADERSRILRSAIEKLPREMQTVIYLIYFENLSCEEVAKVTKKSVKQIYNFLFRAKRDLKTILGEGAKEYL